MANSSYAIGLRSAVAILLVVALTMFVVVSRRVQLRLTPDGKDR
jgi:hypothetical protein